MSVAASTEASTSKKLVVDPHPALIDLFHESKDTERESKDMQVIHERCAGIDVHKILPNRNHLSLMISQRASLLTFFSSLDVV